MSRFRVRVGLRLVVGVGVEGGLGVWPNVVVHVG